MYHSAITDCFIISPLIKTYTSIHNNNIFMHIFESDFINDPTQYLHTFVLSFTI